MPFALLRHGLRLVPTAAGEALASFLVHAGGVGRLCHESHQ
jgi:hypothetical protein